MTDDERTMIDDAQHQLRTYHVGRMTPEEARALEVARLTFGALSDTAVLCRDAGLDGTAVKDALRTASMALLDLIATIEGKR
jgi:hypothetical protein